MPATYTLIASNTLTSTSASVTFSSIPGTYTDLVLKWSARNSINNRYAFVTFNGSTSTIYSATELYGDAISASSTRYSGAGNDTFITIFAGSNLSTATASTFTSNELYIPSYTASQNKPVGSFSAQENNVATDVIIATNAGLFRSTSAITEVTIKAGGATGNFVTNSSFFLYGISSS